MPSTFGVDHDLVVGLIAGGDSAIRKAVEFAEDDSDQGWLDLEEHNIDHNDTVVGIAASGTTPYVVGALKQCNSNQILTAGITCNPGSPLAIEAQHAIVPIVGPEFVTGVKNEIWYSPKTSPQYDFNFTNDQAWSSKR